MRRVACHATEGGSIPLGGASYKGNRIMIKQAFLVDIYDAPRDTVVQAFMDSVELNGNPFYHRWRIGGDHWDDEIAKKMIIVDCWLKDQGLTESDTIIITGFW